MTINLHDITGQESGIILVEMDDGRHMNVVANWGANDGLYAKPEDDIDDGQYVSLFQLYLDGYVLSRTGRK